MVRSSTERNKVYKYVHHEDVSIKTNLTGLHFENEWLAIKKDGHIIVKASSKSGYAWDGCSPKVNFIHLLWGTPDGALDYRTEKPITYYASMIHDVLYQFKETVCVSRKEADIIFREILRESNFMWWPVYGLAVRLGGGLYGKWRIKGHNKNIKIEEFSWLPGKKQIAMEDLKTAIPANTIENSKSL